jgi:hypothetical protein
MQKPDIEMKEAAERVRYEWRQFRWAAETVFMNAPLWEESGTGNGPESFDALKEVLLLYARALRDFFVRRRSDLKKFEQTDLLAEDFFDRSSEWTLPSLPYLLQERDRLNRALAHLSYCRNEYELTGKNWDFPAISAELEDAWRSLMVQLPEERRRWFERA